MKTSREMQYFLLLALANKGGSFSAHATLGNRSTSGFLNSSELDFKGIQSQRTGSEPRGLDQ